VAATPQDFSIWSKLTGNPYPRTPEERMALAPHVRNFVENIGRQGGYIPQPQKSGLSRAVDAIGKTALAAGMLAGGAAIAKHHMETGTGPVAEGLQNLHSRVSDFLGGLGVPTAAAASPEAAESNIQAGTPFETPVQRAEGQDELMIGGSSEAAEAYRRSPHYARMKETYPSLQDIDSPTEPASMPQVVRASMDVTPPTPGEKFGEKIIPADIRVRQAAKGAAPGTVVRSLTETKPVTETARLATSQVPGPHGQDYSLDEHVAIATIARERGDKETHLKHMAEFQRRVQGGEPWRESDATHAAIATARQLASTSSQEYEGTGHMINPSAQPEVSAVSPRVGLRGFNREELMNRQAQRWAKAAYPQAPATQQPQAAAPRQPSTAGPMSDMEFYRVHGRKPNIPAKGNQPMFGGRDLTSQRLAHIHSRGYDPHQEEPPMWW